MHRALEFVFECGSYQMNAWSGLNQSNLLGKLFRLIRHLLIGRIKHTAIGASMATDLLPQ